MVLAVAVKLALEELAPTVTEAGMRNAAVLVESDTAAPPEPAVFDNFTVQVDVAPAPRLLGPHDNEFKTTDVTSKSEAFLETPLKVAVTNAA
jgi:hypothetical protein